MKVGLKRDVSLFALTVYGVGIILGAGIYALIGNAAGLTGNSVWLAFLIASIISSFTGLSYAELTSMFPKTAAEYLYVKKGFRSNLMAFLVGWIEIFADIIGASTVALGFAGYFHALFGTPILYTALGLIAALSVVNFWGITESARLNMLFSFIELFGLLVIVFIALPSIGSVNYLEMPAGATGVFSAAALIFFAFIGFEDMANISEETKQATRNVPKALLYSLLITTAVYIAVAIAAVSVVDWHQLATSKAPLALVASTALGQTAFTLMSVIALFATANTVLILLIVGSREIYGISRDGSLPKLLSKVHPRRRTPWVAIIATAAVAMLFALFERIQLVAGITDFGTFVVFLFVNSAVILLRYRMPKARRRFRLPVNIGRLPLIPLFGLFITLLLMLHLDALTVAYGLAVLMLGVPVYFALKKKFGVEFINRVK